MYKAIFDRKQIVWKVVNIETKAIQSAWHNEVDAVQVARDLNKALGKKSTSGV